MLVDEYLAKVVANIRSKEVKISIKKELKNHLQNVINERKKKGISTEQAVKEAIELMGDANVLGSKLSKIHKPTFDWFLFLGFIMLLALSFLPFISLDETHFLYTKIIYTIIGLIICIYCIFFDYRKLANYGLLLYMIGMMILIFLSMSPTIINGKPYIQIANFFVESSYTLPIFLLAWASFLQKGKMKGWQFISFYFLSILFLLKVANLFLIFLYTLLVIVFIYYSEQQKREKWYSSLFVFITLLSIFIFKMITEPVLLERMKGFFQPEAYANTTGYMFIKGREYLLNAGWLGHKEGANDSFSLPEAYTDYIFVTIIYEFGWLVGFIILIILLMLAIRMIHYLKILREPYGRLLIIGAIILYTVTFSWSILMAMGILPIVSVSLPFFSYGFIPVVLHSFLIGIVMSVYRRKNML